MSWIILFFAGLFEVGWAVGLKYTDGFSRPLPTALTIAAMAVSLGLLGLAMKELPLGTAYAIWTGVGAVGTVIAGIILFGESMALFRLASVALIIAGLVGLKISAGTLPRQRLQPHPLCSRWPDRAPPANNGSRVSAHVAPSPARAAFFASLHSLLSARLLPALLATTACARTPYWDHD